MKKQLTIKETLTLSKTLYFCQKKHNVKQMLQ